MAEGNGDALVPNHKASAEAKHSADNHNRVQNQVPEIPQGAFVRKQEHRSLASLAFELLSSIIQSNAKKNFLLSFITEENVYMCMYFTIKDRCL